MTPFGPQERLALAERFASSGQLTLPAVARNVRKLLGDDWPEFAEKHGLGETATVTARPALRSPRVSLCVHLGDEVRRQNCPTCRGNIQVKVLSCVLFGEATVGKLIAGLACCQTCLKYEPREGS